MIDTNKQSDRIRYLETEGYEISLSWSTDDVAWFLTKDKFGKVVVIQYFGEYVYFRQPDSCKKSDIDFAISINPSFICYTIPKEKQIIEALTKNPSLCGCVDFPKYLLTNTIIVSVFEHNDKIIDEIYDIEEDLQLLLISKRPDMLSEIIWIGRTTPSLERLAKIEDFNERAMIAKLLSMKIPA